MVRKIDIIDLSKARKKEKERLTLGKGKSQTGEQIEKITIGELNIQSENDIFNAQKN